MTSFKSLIGASALACLASAAQAQVVGIATNPQGSLYYSVGTAIAGVVQQKAGMPARVQPMSGSTAYTPPLNRGEVEFGLLNAVDVGNAYNGVLNFKDRKNTDLRLVGVVFSIQNGIAVAKDSPAKSLADLKGLRIPSRFTAQSTMQFVQDAILASGGLSTADMKGFPVADQFKGMQALGEGKVDAALSCFTCATAKEVDIALASRGGMRFLPLSDAPEAKAAMRKLFPAARSQVFSPSPAFTGINTPTRLFAYSAFLVSSKHVSADVIYKVTKAIYESKATLAANSPPMKTFDPVAMAEPNIVPYHPGAEKFFREIGQWPPKDQ
ncbi:MAG: TAXI family TRAP transporter solute-binding subunit [Betaproteobacteria bacterium]|nr:TAXI family TRAP transporter solute-binding subunit [Betaproteobacteria bacterium]